MSQTSDALPRFAASRSAAQRLALRLDYNLLLVLAVPAVLMLCNQEWLFPRGNPTDNWLNYAYFFDYGNPHLAISGEEGYKAVRLSWIWKAWVFFHLFRPLVAYYLLHLSTFFTCIVAFYYTAKAMLDEDSAVFGTIAFGTYSQFHNITSFEWDYQTHDAAATILLTALCLVLAAKRPGWRWLLLGAGAAAACAFQSPYNLSYGPSLAITYFLLNRESRRNPLIESALLFVVGGVAITLIFCIGSYACGGPFLFFMPQVDLSLYVVPTWAYHPGYWLPLLQVFAMPKGAGVAMPFYIGFVSAALVVWRILRGKRSGVSNAVLICLVSLLTTLPVNVLAQLRGHPLLNDDHMVIALAPFVFVAATAIFAYLLEFVPRGSGLWAAKLTAAVLFCGVLMLSP